MFTLSSLRLRRFRRLACIVSLGASSFAIGNPDAHTHLPYNERFLSEIRHDFPQSGLTLFVSQQKGDDKNLGTSDAPFQTLTAARDHIRKLTEIPKGGIEVVVSPGRYHFTETLQLDQKDSGAEDSPIVWRGLSSKEVILAGGIPVDTTSFRKVADPEKRARLHPLARESVQVTLLSERAAKELAQHKGSQAVLSLDGHLLEVAKWPNRGYHHIESILSSGPITRFMAPGEEPPAYSFQEPTGGRFTFREELSPLLSQELARSQNMWAEGYPSNDWYFQREAIASIQDGAVQLLRHTRYGIQDGIKSLPRRIRLVNVLAELDEPGEWYFDHLSKELFLWPIKGFDPQKSSLVIPGGPDLIAINGASHLCLRDFTIENFGKHAITIRGGHHNLIAGCTIRNGLGRGITVSGGHHHGITACDIHSVCSAFGMSGGKFPTLERCYHYATNNRIHHCRRRGYGVVGLSGVGFYFANNLIHDMNGAVNYRTADLLMEFNEFYNIGYEMGDFNAAYCGAQWHTMGNVLRYNFVHHLIEPGGHPISPFRNDDGGAGLKIFGNVFYRPGRCAAQFAGPANELRNNITIDANTLWWTNKRPTEPAEIEAEWKRLDRFGRDLPHGDKGDHLHITERSLGEKAWLKSPWKDEYPIMAKFIETNPWAQTFCKVTVNYAHGLSKPFHIHGGDGTVAGMESKEEGTFPDLPSEGTFEAPVEIPLAAFRNLEVLDLNFKDSFEPMAGFQTIPFDSIGLTSSPFRQETPSKEDYRNQVYLRFKDDRTRRYQPAIVNARYPIPEYLK